MMIIVQIFMRKTLHKSVINKNAEDDFPSESATVVLHTDVTEMYVNGLDNQHVNKTHYNMKASFQNITESHIPVSKDGAKLMNLLGSVHMALLSLSFVVCLWDCLQPCTSSAEC